MATTIHCKNNWRWLVCALNGRGLTNLDRLATKQSLQYVLDDTAQFTCDVPSDNDQIYTHADDSNPRVAFGRRLIYGFRREEPINGPPWNSTTVYEPGDGVMHLGGSYDAVAVNLDVEPGVTLGWENDWDAVTLNPWRCRFTGILNIAQDQSGTDEPVTHLTAYDAMTWTKFLPVLTPDGYLLSEKGYTYFNKRGDEIVLDVIANAFAFINSNSAFFSMGRYQWPTGFADMANVLFIDIAGGHFDHTDPIQEFPIQQGASVYDVWQQLCQTGGLDIVLDPVYRPREAPGQIARLNVYSQAGSDQTGAVFGWDMFPRNLIGVDHLFDGTQIENWVQFFAGGLVAPHQFAPTSIESFGPYFAQKNITQGSSAAVSLLALAEIALRKRGKQTLTIDPTPELSPDPFTHYYLGDTVYVWAGRKLQPLTSGGRGTALRQGVRSPQAGTPPQSPWRVYGFQVDLADDQVETITNLLLTDPGTTNL